MKLIQNPCKSICKTKDNVCIGCKRTTEEIQNWASLSNEEKKLIVERIKNIDGDPDTFRH